MQRKFWIGWGTAVFLLLIVGCQRAPELTLVTHQSDNLGIEVGYPDGWVLDENVEELIFASDTAVVTNNDYANNGAMILFSEPQQRVGNDLVAFLEETVVVNATDFVVEPPASLKISGEDAATILTASPVGDIDVFLGTTVIAHGEEVLFVLTIYDSAIEDSMAPTLDAMLRSVTFVP